MDDRDADEDSGSNTIFVKSLERGLAVIRAFDADHPSMTLSEVARIAGLTRAAARRFLHTLVTMGYMRSDGPLFRLTPRTLELGYAYLSSLTLPEVATPHLERLVEKIRESSSMCVLDGDDIVYVARVPTKRIMTVGISVGTRFPAYATSMGRVLLAAHSDEWLQGYLSSTRLHQMTPHTITDRGAMFDELRQIRAQGWAFVDQELEEGLRSLAVPVRDRSKTVVAAVNVSVHTSRGSATSVYKEMLPPLLESAEQIERDLYSSR